MSTFSPVRTPIIGRWISGENAGGRGSIVDVRAGNIYTLAADGGRAFGRANFFRADTGESGDQLLALLLPRPGVSALYRGAIREALAAAYSVAKMGLLTPSWVSDLRLAEAWGGGQATPWPHSGPPSATSGGVKARGATAAGRSALTPPSGAGTPMRRARPTWGSMALLAALFPSEEVLFRLPRAPTKMSGEPKNKGACSVTYWPQAVRGCTHPRLTRGSKMISARKHVIVVGVSIIGLVAVSLAVRRTIRAIECRTGPRYPAVADLPRGLEKNPARPTYDAVALRRGGASSLEIFAREPRDESWANAMEAVVRTGVREDLRHGAAAAALESVECRTSSCRVRISTVPALQERAFRALQFTVWGELCWLS